MRRRLPLVVAGYGLAAVAKVLLALASIWPFVLFARFVDASGAPLPVTADGRAALGPEDSRALDRQLRPRPPVAEALSESVGEIAKSALTVALSVVDPPFGPRADRDPMPSTASFSCSIE